MPSPRIVKFKGLRERVLEQRSAGHPFAIFRKPSDSQILGVFQDSPEALPLPGADAQGFIAVPFDARSSKPVWIRADRTCACSFTRQHLALDAKMPPEDEAARELHLGLVTEALDSIRMNSMEKVVLARRFSVPLPEDAFQIFKSLLQTYPEAYCYYWHHPQYGTWMGASPELLIDYANGQLKTVSLAGTRPAQGAAPPEFGEKESCEQALVTSYILEAMRELRMNPEVTAAKPVRAGRVWHLETRLSARADHSRALRLVDRMHPTPAVCGSPLEPALAFIRQHENFNRDFYTGYLGDIGMFEAGTFTFYVNLRCMQLWEDKAFIYVGGGITEASDPEAEWEETRQKSMTMLSVLQNS